MDDAATAATALDDGLADEEESLSVPEDWLSLEATELEERDE